MGPGRLVNKRTGQLVPVGDEDCCCHVRHDRRVATILVKTSVVPLELVVAWWSCFDEADPLSKGC
jgi:hypothetical protein